MARGDNPRPRFVPGKEPPTLGARPRCPECGAMLQPLILGGLSLVHGEEMRRWEGNYEGYADTFCRLNCAAEFGLAAFKQLKEK